MDLLSRREHSRVELEQKLKTRDFEPDEIQQALDELNEQGLQSDSRFVENFVHYRANRGYGPTHIRSDLMQRGVSEACIDEQMAYYDQSYWIDQCTKAWFKKFGGEVPEDYPSKMKQLRFLQYRGFSPELANRCLEKDYENQ